MRDVTLCLVVKLAEGMVLLGMKKRGFGIGKWKGEPRETEEMRPKWFALEEIPFEKMWDDNKYWLARVLKGEKLSAKIVFEQGEKRIKCETMPL